MNKDFIDFANANRSPDDTAVLQKILSFIKQTTKMQDVWYWYPLFDIKGNIPVAAYDLGKIYAHNKMTFLDNHKIKMLADVLKKCHIISAFVFQFQTSDAGVK